MKPPASKGSVSGSSIAHRRPDPHWAQWSPQNQAHRLTWPLTSFFSSCLISALTIPSWKIEQIQSRCYRPGPWTGRTLVILPTCPPPWTHIPCPHHVSWNMSQNTSDSSKTEVLWSLLQFARFTLYEWRWRTLALGSRWSAFDPWLCHFLAGWLWANHWSFWV